MNTLIDAFGSTKDIAGASNSKTLKSALDALLTDKSASDTTAMAASDGAQGLATRFALVALNPSLYWRVLITALSMQMGCWSVLILIPAWVN